MVRRTASMESQTPHDVTGLAVMVGEIRGQMREVVHTLNNVSSKLDSIGREVISMGPLAADIAEVKGELKAASVKIELLEKAKNKQEGVTGFLDWLFKNWPGIIGFLLLIGLLLRSEGLIK
jgi:hypothetical protein